MNKALFIIPHPSTFRRGSRQAGSGNYSSSTLSGVLSLSKYLSKGAGRLVPELQFFAFKKQALLLYKMAKKRGGVLRLSSAELLYKNFFLTQSARRLAQSDVLSLSKQTAEKRLEGGLV